MRYIAFEIPSQMEAICERTPRELQKAQIEELQRFQDGIQAMKKVGRNRKDYYDCLEKYIIEGIGRTLMTIGQLMVIYRLSADGINDCVKSIQRSRRWGYDFD